MANEEVIYVDGYVSYVPMWFKNLEMGNVPGFSFALVTVNLQPAKNEAQTWEEFLKLERLRCLPGGTGWQSNLPG
jgi:hypothetical protein